MNVFNTALRVLFFRASQGELQSLGRPHLVIGLLTTWLVGIGRYWDDPRAAVGQHIGLGSVIYVFALSLLLWGVMIPLRPKNWSYRLVLTFVSLTALPAALYAIPVERFMTLNVARETNAWFLAAVAAWRIALLMWFLNRAVGLDFLRVVVGSLLPLTAIVTSLTALNLERAVFAMMRGLREDEGTANDSAYFILLLLTLVSAFLIWPLVITYVVLWFTGRRQSPDPTP